MGLSRLLFLLGSAPYLFLGAAHAFATPLTTASRKGLMPRDPELPGRMTRSCLRLTPAVDMWHAWIGFNLSHSLGAILFGLFVLLTGRSDPIFALEARLALPLATAISALYLGIGLRYWFRIPITGITISTACFATAWVLLPTG